MTVFFLSLLLIWIPGCARELSEEDLKREKRRREASRLEVGVAQFEGALSNELQNHVPVSLQIEMLTDPRDERQIPFLEARLKVGFFGGVQLLSTSVLFDWGSGEIFAQFGGGSNGGRVELKGRIQEGVFQDGELISSHGGRFDFVDQILSEQDEFWFKSTSGAEAFLTLISSREKVEAPPTASLPFLPSLEGTVIFQHLQMTPHRAHRVYYDPLKGLLEIGTSASTKIFFDNVFVSKSPNLPLENSEAGVLNGGKIMRGASELMEFKPLPNQAKLLPLEDDQLFPRFYRGRLQGKTSDYLVVAELSYLQQNGKNQEYHEAFEDYPQFRLNTILCLQDKPYAYLSADTRNFDFFANQATFESQEGVTIEMKYDPAFEKISLNMQNRGSNDAIGGAQIQLQKTEKIDEPCFESL